MFSWLLILRKKFATSKLKAAGLNGRALSMLEILLLLSLRYDYNSFLNFCDDNPLPLYSRMILVLLSTRTCIQILMNFCLMPNQMHKKHSVKSVLLGKDTFAVTVYPNVDYAFIVALVVILEEINEDRSDDD